MGLLPNVIEIGSSDVVVAVVTVLGAIVIEILRRRLSAAKATLDERTAEKVAADTEHTMVDTVKEVLAEVRVELVNKSTELQRVHAVVGDQERRVRAVEHSQQEIRVALAAHGQWDLHVLAQVRKVEPDFPDPPPLLKFDPET